MQRMIGNIYILSLYSLSFVSSLVVVLTSHSVLPAVARPAVQRRVPPAAARLKVAYPAAAEVVGQGTEPRESLSLSRDWRSVRGQSPRESVPEPRLAAGQGTEPERVCP